MEIITIDGYEYYDANSLRNLYPEYFHGVGDRIRNTVTLKHISQDYYTLATYNKKLNKWSHSNANKATLLLLVDWCKEHIIEAEDIKVAPTILKLNNNELFRDDNGNVIKITVRGTRKHDECYFSVTDIAKGFDTPRIRQSITDKRYDGYKIHQDYEFFIVKKCDSIACSENKSKKYIKVLYLTYHGLVRFLYVSRNKNAIKFTKWATEILFTHHIGTDEQKIALSDKLLGTCTKSALQTLNKSSGEISCIYLLTLGYVKDIRESFNIPSTIPDDYLLCKYGNSKELQRRLKDHNTNFGKIKGVNLKIKTFSVIGVDKIKNAEDDVKEYLKPIKEKCTIRNYSELFIIDKDTIENIVTQYERIKLFYSKDLDMIDKELKELIREHENEINVMKLKHESELQAEKHKVEIVTIEKQAISRELEQNQEIMRLKDQLYKI